jgi:hypothetical protein
MRSTLGPSRLKSVIKSVFAPVKSGSAKLAFSYERPTNPGAIEPAAVELTVIAAGVIVPDGVGCGFTSTGATGFAGAVPELFAIEAQPESREAAAIPAAPRTAPRRTLRRVNVDLGKRIFLRDLSVRCVRSVVYRTYEVDNSANALGSEQITAIGEIRRLHFA